MNIRDENISEQVERIWLERAVSYGLISDEEANKIHREHYGDGAKDLR